MIAPVSHAELIASIREQIARSRVLVDAHHAACLAYNQRLGAKPAPTSPVKSTFPLKIHNLPSSG